MTDAAMRKRGVREIENSRPEIQDILRDFGHLSEVTRGARKQVAGCNATLPTHIIEDILSRLPVQSLFRARAVCKAWNQCFVSPYFRRLYEDASPALFLAFRGEANHEQPIGIYDPSVNSWQSPPHFPFFVKRRCLQRPYQVAADGGLVAYAFLENDTLNFHVCNPITGSFRELPKMANSFYPESLFMSFSKASHMRNSIYPEHCYIPTVSMVHDGAGNYKVILVGHWPLQAKLTAALTVYDSITGNWSDVDVLTSKYRWDSCDPLPCVLHKGVVYVRCADHEGVLFTYDIHEQNWSIIHVPLEKGLTSCGITFCEKLLTFEGRVLLVLVAGDLDGIVGEFVVRPTNGDTLYILELQMSPNFMWREIARMPQSLFWEMIFNEGSQSGYQCCQVGNSIVLVSCSELHINRYRIYAYSLTTKQWSNISSQVYCGAWNASHFFQGVSFKASLDAQP